VGGAVAESRTLKTGLRSIVLRREPDQWGRSFELVVNDVPVFAKGANVIPFDSFPNRVTRARYRRMLQSAKEANMNMIRHWGGGYYETDEFYQICDELGIMVWQDFMFGNDWQPGTYAFKLNIEAEAEDQLRRMRNHPSIVLWCGNNETESAIGWGPQREPAEVRYQMWQDYLTEFSGILPRVVARLVPGTPYWPSSPSADYEPLTDAYQSGDAHIWDVWHGRQPFATYETHHARFVTEYGFQSFPEMRTVKAFTLPEDRASIFTPVMLMHQKDKEGNQIIQDYLLKEYAEPKDFESFLYLSQVQQAEGIKLGAEHMRRERSRTMGSLFWQLNDCWPAASWSSIDYYGRWKALQYYARRFYAPVLVSPHVENDALEVYVVSDKTQTEKARLRVRLMDFDGNVMLEEEHHVAITPLSSKVYLEWPLQRLKDAGVTDTSRVFIAAELSDNGETYSRSLAFIAKVNELHLEPPKLTVTVQVPHGTVRAPLPLGTGANSPAVSYEIEVASAALARSVYISFGELDVHLSDNYFDVLPGENVVIRGSGTASIDAVKAQLKVVSLADAFAASMPQH
jgi:beta-mannosidase